MHSVHLNSTPIVSVLLAAFAFFATILLFLRYARLRPPQAIVAWLVTLVAAGLAGLYQHDKLGDLGRMGLSAFARNPGDRVLSAVCTGIFILLAAAFCIRLYRQWLDGELTEAERAGGTVGIRAWLSPGNLLMSALIAISAWQGLGWSVLLMLVIAIGALVAWPALHASSSPAPSTMHVSNGPTQAQDYSREREKVLSLLESGKITAEESAELLQALAAASTPPPASPSPQTGTRSALPLAGAALVLVGFFLPWFSFSPGAKLASVMEEFHGGMHAPMLEMSKALPVQSVRVRGGDIANGLGWIVLVLALASALLPHLAPNLDRASLRTFRLLAVAGGGIILLYLLSQDPGSVSIGLILALIGYACAGLALWREERPPVLAPRSAEAQI